jgi:hypothetical protein
MEGLVTPSDYYPAAQSVHIFFEQLCYNYPMKKETFKEFGKLLYDFAKIGFAIIIITH